MGEETKKCPACAEDIKAQATICRFCKYDFRTGSVPDALPPPGIQVPSKGVSPLLIILICVGATVPIIAIIAAIAIPGLLASQRASNERNASASLRTLATAEADFRANDRDGNKVQDFWTGDVAGLYCVTEGEGGQPNKLIELSIAAADASPLPPGSSGGRHSGMARFTVQSPKAGYLYRAMTHDATGEPYGQDTKGAQPKGGSWGKVHNCMAFGFCSYPERYPASGKLTFILNEDNTVWKKDTKGAPVLRWPADPTAEGWTRRE